MLSSSIPILQRCTHTIVIIDIGHSDNDSLIIIVIVMMMMIVR